MQLSCALNRQATRTIALRPVSHSPALAQRPVCRRLERRFGRFHCAGSFQDAAVTPIADAKLPDAPGVYAVYDSAGTLQYIGLSRKLNASISTHAAEQQDSTHSCKVLTVANPTRDALTAAWKEWIENAVAETGNIPPGNQPGETKWQQRPAKSLKPEIRLTAGKAISGVTIEQLVDAVVKGNRVVAFVKGTRREPQCGFSHKMMTLLNEARADYEVVNVLDEVHNPGLRDVIKTYSQWPTIPQLYVDGEFVGGADIVEQMAGSGELARAVQSKAGSK